MTSFKSPLGDKNVGNTRGYRQVEVPYEDGINSSFNKTNELNKLDEINLLRQQRGLPLLDENFFATGHSNHTNAIPSNNMMSASSSVMSPKEMEQQLEVRKLKNKGIEHLSAGAKQRIELLLNMTRLTAVAELAGIKFGLKTLTSNEIQEVLLTSSQFEGSISGIFELKKNFLARSLFSINNNSLEEFLGSDDIFDTLAFLGEMDDNLINALYVEFEKLTKESSKKFGLNTPEAVKEVVEDLKK